MSPLVSLVDPGEPQEDGAGDCFQHSGMHAFAAFNKCSSTNHSPFCFMPSAQIKTSRDFYLNLLGNITL